MHPIILPRYLYLYLEKPPIPENFEEVTWLKLAEAVGAIQRSCAIRYSLEELYQAVENMCSYKMAAGLYQHLKQACQKHVRASLQQFLGYPLVASTGGIRSAKAF